MELVYQFKNDDKNKLYGIKNYFDLCLKSGKKIKGLGIFTNEKYAFKLCEGTDHVRIIDDVHKILNLEARDDDKNFTFIVDNSNLYSLNLYGPGFVSEFSRDCSIEILKEFKFFLEENENKINFDNVKLDIARNFFGQNQMYQVNGFINNKELTYKTIDNAINDIKNQYKEYENKIDQINNSILEYIFFNNIISKKEKVLRKK